MHKSKEEPIAINELQSFMDHVESNIDVKYNSTLDYLNLSPGITWYGGVPPSRNLFSLSILHEILCFLKPDHFLWNKIKYLAFFLNLAERNIDFGILYTIFHQLEEKVNLQQNQWEDDEIRKLIQDELIAKVIVKDNHEEDFEFSVNEGLKPNINSYESVNDNCNTFNEEILYNDDFESFSEDIKPDIGDFEQTIVITCNTKNGIDKSILENQSRLFRLSKSNIKFEEQNFQDVIEPKKKKSLKNLICEKKKTTKLSDNALKREKKSQNRKTRKGRNGDSKTSKKAKQCAICGFKAPYQLALDRHEFKTHQATKLCTEDLKDGERWCHCGHLSNTYEDYILHDKTHPLKCEKCEKKVFGHLALKIHMKKHDEVKTEKIACDICGSLITIGSLKNHKESMHSGVEYNCDMCDYVSKCRHAIKKHKESHFRMQKKCPDCGGMFKELNKHYQRSCPARQYKRHKCDLCEKTFSLHHGLKKHIKTQHHNISEFQCKFCDYAAKSSYTLKGHVMSKHEKKRLYEFCKICNKRTSQMEYHMKRFHVAEYLQSTKDDTSSEIGINENDDTDNNTNF